MTNQSMGVFICAQRKKKGMTQKELAEKLNVTDKAVSKWERDVAYPETATIPKLAEILEVSVEELIQAKSLCVPVKKQKTDLMDIILKGVAIAMGISTTVAAALGQVDVRSGFGMLGIGMASIGFYLLKSKE